ncbi:synaptobrevin homolog 2-like isoform X2 [Chelonus insularis]|uniref:synaptobrevin homolog 2-like isoform X2 n=1 Tax=Chelonus insularis TaxID=460826 RepID=UPI00158B493C|nr:synaptobrevin homolog 2-like isoform X2 [Chelonus insularis]
MASFNRSTVTSSDVRSANPDERETLLEHDSDPDEDMIFNRSSVSSDDVEVHRKIDSVKVQIREVTEVMRDNVQRVLERGERLEDLQMASDRLNIAGNEFRDAAKKAQRRAWIQNIKSRALVVGITIIIILCIIVPIIVKYS